MTIHNKYKLARGAGILMPVSSIPSPYGIGTLGSKAYHFIDFLERIGCRYWQVLPVGPTSFGDSPYQSFSAFAGNPYFIDLDILAEGGLLSREEILGFPWQVRDDEVDYEKIYQNRFNVLKTAYGRSRHADTEEFVKFCADNEYWLEDYCFYMAVKEYFGNREWLLWDEDIRDRREEELIRYREFLKSEISFWKFCQFEFRKQWDRLKRYANDRNILIIGDIPLYVAMDSSDVWVHSSLFELDERKNPIHVAGVPPDAFSDLGQRWGNPIYRWDVMEKDDFTWWRERMKTCASLYDIVRIDHFIGVVNYYSIPEECPTAVRGRWEKGPGEKLTDIIMASIGDTKIIAEDLGVITPEVRELIKKTGFPGMKILEFGLEGPADHEYLPHNYKDTNIVVYTGTHDNETLVGFLKNKNEKQLEYPYSYFGVSKLSELPYAIIRALYASTADTVIIQMQDILELDNSARMNLPATIGGNWKWRLTENQYRDLDEDRLLLLAEVFNRKPVLRT